MEQLATPADAAKILNVPLTRVWSYCRNGVLPPGVCVRLGRQYRINVPELKRWVDGGGNREGGCR